MSEAYLEDLLVHMAESSRRFVEGLYDLAWGSFALKEIDGDYERFLVDVRSAVSALVASGNLLDVLYDYRRAVGISLSIYLYGARKVGFTEKRLSEICSILAQNSKDSGLAEIIGVSFLLAKHLGREDIEQEIRSLMMEIKSLCSKNPAYHLTDLLFITFFSAVAHDKFFIEALEDIRQNQSWMTYVDNDPERMALLLYALSKAAFSKNVEAGLAEWCHTEVNRIAEKLRRALEANRLISLQSYAELIDALLGAAEGFGAHVEQKFGSLIKVEDDKIVVSRKAIAPFLPRADLLAKACIALSEAGYICPFMLSKREADAYRQIKAELKGYRRIRKHELLSIMAASTLFIFLTLSLILTGNIAVLLEMLADKTVLYICLGVLLSIVGLYGWIWKEGHISWKELLEFLRGIYKLIMKL